MNNSSAVDEPSVPFAPPGPEDYQEYSSSRRGRPRKAQNSARVEQVLQLYFVERLSMRKVAEVVGMSHMSVYRMLSDPNLELLL